MWFELTSITYIFIVFFKFSLRIFQMIFSLFCILFIYYFIFGFCCLCSLGVYIFLSCAPFLWPNSLLLSQPSFHHHHHQSSHCIRAREILLGLDPHLQLSPNPIQSKVETVAEGLHTERRGWKDRICSKVC